MKQNIKKIIPKSIKDLLRPLKKKLLDNPKKKALFLQMQTKHYQLIEEKKGKEKLKVVFLAIHKSVWKVNPVFKKMLEDQYFEPLILVCPYTAYDEERMWEDMKGTYEYFEEKGYPLLSSYDKKEDRWLSLEDIKPDIVFFTNPHNLTRKEYYEDAYMNYLSCYVNYSFILTKSEESQFNLMFHNAVWKNFYETTIHKKMAYEYAANKASNVIVSGYPMCDIFFDKSYTPKNPWLTQKKIKKKIIWAPHHSIMEDDLNYSCFLKDFNFMLSMAEKYVENIQIAFKPHPILRSKLELNKCWGKEKTDLYYKKWSDMSNTQFEDGNYIDLFLTSDAMIFDSNSFITEYLYTLKPSIFTIVNSKVYNSFNEYGVKAFSLLDKAYTQDEIEDFLINIINCIKMDNVESKQKFISLYLKPNGNSASNFIFDNIKKEIIK